MSKKTYFVRITPKPTSWIRHESTSIEKCKEEIKSFGWVPYEVRETKPTLQEQGYLQ